MNINIGEKIKNYRKTKELTQEQLANSLNISFQAISKWERGDAYPDVEMIPRIAYFFNTTTDDLLCVDQVAIEEDIKDYLERHSKACNIGNTQEALSIMREATTKYPGNFNLMQMLSFSIGWNSNHVDDEQRKKNSEEIVELSEKILAECTDSSIRFGTLQGLCFNLKGLGQKDRAIEIVNKELPDIYLTTNLMLSYLLEGDELIKHTQENLILFLHSTVEAMCHLAKDFEHGAKLAVYENALKMYEFIYADGDYHLHHGEVMDKYSKMINIYLEKGDYEKALSCVEKAKNHAVIFDTLPVNTMHTSPLINKLEYTGVWKNYKGNKCWHFLKDFETEKYDVVRNDERFKAIVKEVEKYARDDI